MNARSLESRRRTPTKSASSTFWGMMMCANDTRKIFHRSIEEKRYFESRKRTRDAKTFHSRERERERGFGERAAIKNFFAAIFDWWFQNFLFRFPFFPLLLLFFSTEAVFTGKKNEKFGLNSASKRPH